MNPDTRAQRALITISSGPNIPTCYAAPFHIATLLVYMDAEVILFLSDEGVQLARRVVADQLRALDGDESLYHFIRRVCEAGACLLTRRQSGMSIDENELIEELDEISSGGGLARLILEFE